MGFRRWVAQLDLVAVLLFVVVLELVLNRLAVNVLRPPGVKAPPLWHRNLDMAGLFVFHLASVLAVGVTGYKAWLRITSPGLARPFRAILAVTTAAFLLLAAWGVVRDAPLALTFRLEAAFVALLATLVVGVALAPADRRLKVALVVLFLPFALHFYGTLRLALLTEPEAAVLSNLPDRVRAMGQHAVAIAALAAPLLLGPAPLIRSLARPAPMILSAFVASIGAVILRRHFEVGMELASRGLGMELGPGAPPETMAMYVASASAAVWTLTSCLTAESPNRRLAGFGFGLVVVGGYGFAWPLMYLCAGAGFLAMATAALHVRGEEHAQAVALTPAPRFSSPPIPEEAWHGYIDGLAQALGARVETELVEGREETTLHAERAGRHLGVRLVRDARTPRGLELVDVVVARLPQDLEPPLSSPGWTLSARPSGLLAMGAHPPPPEAHGAAHKTGDAAFDQRFKIHDGGRLTDKLLDEGLRARATAMLDGWVALWPGRCLEYRVCPGRGAPLDHPVPVTELAFRAPAEPPVERLVRVVELLVELSARGLPEAAPAGEPGALDRGSSPA